MNKVQGDLIKMAIEGKFDVIVHGCNCFCSMGKGIAKSIKEQLPEAFRADLATVRGDKLKLGTYSFARVVRGNSKFVVVNAYTQFDFWTKGPRIDYPAVAAVMAKLRVDFPNARIGYPLIGAGLAGGDWSKIAALIDRELDGVDHTLVEFIPA